MLVRFADDTVVICLTRAQAEAALVRLRSLLAELVLAPDAPRPGSCTWPLVASGSTSSVSIIAWSARPGTRAFVCENPTVLEAPADELGTGCPPLVCTDGNPSLAALNLVCGIAAAGCAVTVRADVDDAGFVVVAQVRAAARDATILAFRHRHLLLVPGNHRHTRSAGRRETRLGRLRDLYATRRFHCTGRHSSTNSSAPWPWPADSVLAPPRGPAGGGR